MTTSGTKLHKVIMHSDEQQHANVEFGLDPHTVRSCVCISEQSKQLPIVLNKSARKVNVM